MSLFDISRSTSAPPVLDYNMVFAYPPTCESEHSPRTPDHRRSPSDSSPEIVKKVVDKGLEEEDGPLVYYPFSYRQPCGVFQNVVEMGKDQMGCRLLQRKLQEKNCYVFQSIFNQVIHDFPSLMTDSFGNYLCQKVIEESSEAHLALIVNVVASKTVEISLNSHGTRAIQKLIESCAVYSLIDTLIASIADSVVVLAKDVNGNHVIQKCLSELSPEKSGFLYETAKKHIVEIATHRHGCCVLQRCIDASLKNDRPDFIDCVVENSVKIVQDAFGNYVVQYILDLGIPEVNERLARRFCQNIRDLSRQKFSSNVIEKCLQLNSPDVQALMIEEINKQIKVMIDDQYANYVVQRALQLAKPNAQKKMLSHIAKYFDKLKESTVGKRILSKLTKNYPSLADKR